MEVKIDQLNIFYVLCQSYEISYLSSEGTVFELATWMYKVGIVIKPVHYRLRNTKQENVHTFPNSH